MKKLFLTLFLIVFAFPALAADEVYERVMTAGKIRCGYFVWPPFMDKDVNSGAFSGYFYDLMEEIGKELSLKIEWTEEVAFSNMFEGYKGGRFDMICGPLVPTPGRARASDFTMPLVYFPMYLYAQEGDTRFDNNFAAANSPEIKVAVLEGEMSEIVAAKDFPEAQKISVMNLTDATSLMMTLATKKADVSASEPILPMKFMQNNPGKIRVVEGGPIRALPVSMSIPPGEYKFKRLLDITIQALLDSGTVEELAVHYIPEEGIVLPITKPYEASK